MPETQLKTADAHLAETLPKVHPLRYHNRRTEPERIFFRGGRYFTVGHEWFVTLREGIDLGPFLRQETAELAAARHIAGACIDSPGGIADLFHHTETEATEFEMLVRELVEGLEQRLLRSDNCAYVWTQQRLDSLRRHPEKQTRVSTRIRALEYLMDEFEGHTPGDSWNERQHESKPELTDAIYEAYLNV